MTEYLSLNTGVGVHLSEFPNYFSFEMIGINQIEIDAIFKGTCFGHAQQGTFYVVC